MCAPLAVVAAGVSAAGTLVGGVQSLLQGNYQSAVMRQNARMEDEAARDSIARGRDEARTFYRQLGGVKGQEIAAMAANGIDPSFGSALRLQQDTAAAGEEDAANLYKNTEQRTKGFFISAANDRAEASAAKARGRAAFVSSILEAGGSLMSGFQQQKALKAKLGIVSRGDVRSMIRHNPGTF